MRGVFIVDAARTAIGRFNGALARMSARALGSTVVQQLLARRGIAAEQVDEVIFGNVLQAGLGQNIARQVAIDAGVPTEKTAFTVNMVCASGLRSVMLAAQNILCGDAELIVAGGTENMSQSPYLLPKARSGYRMGHGQLVDVMVHDGLWDVFNDYHMGITAENIAERFNISREEQDQFACLSQNRAEIAQNENRFAAEIIPVAGAGSRGATENFCVDESPRHRTTEKGLSRLDPVFKPGGTVTAGNASGISDGAAAVVVADEKTVTRLGLQPLARVVSHAVGGVDPAIMGRAPVEAVKKALNKAAWRVTDLDLIESNEAFAAQAICVNRMLEWNTDRVNINGGAIALGHPIGASGARILTTLLFAMKHQQARRGIATLCVGGGMGAAMCVEAV